MTSPSHKVHIINYGAGNIFSLVQAFAAVGTESVVVTEPAEVRSSGALVLPGVGAFGPAMKRLRELGIEQAVVDHAREGKPLMGICLGMQLLLDESEEMGSFRGLGLIAGNVVKIPSISSTGERRCVPAVGWQSVELAGTPSDGSLFDGVSSPYMYFVHSYYASPVDPKSVHLKTSYQGFEYCAAVRKENLFATQFHPEKSGPAGLRLLENWIKTTSRT